MRQRFTIGLTASTPGWLILLRQIGAPFEIVDWNGVSADRYAVIIVSDDPDRTQAAALDRFLGEGGSLLDNGGWLRRAEPGSFRRRRVGSIHPDHDDPVFARSGVRLLDVDDRIRVHRSASHLGRTILLREHGKGEGSIVHLPFDIGRVHTRADYKRRRFYNPTLPHPDEVVASTPRGEYRRAIAATIQWLFERRGLPLLHLAPTPRDAGLFCFRIDSDYGSPDEMRALYEVARTAGIRMTWFLHVDAHQEYLDLFRQFEGDEMGVHCFRHRTFEAYDENFANITEARTLLDRAGIPTAGFAAPNGRWNMELDRAVEDLGFEYASEFTLDYDNLPFHPWRRGRFSHVLQVPIHPISVGNFMRVKADVESMKQYYRSVIEWTHALGEPVMLYHHPTHHASEVIADIFSAVREHRIPNMTMGEYAAWWKQRGESSFDAEMIDGEITITMARPDDSIQLRALHGARTATIAGPGGYSFDALSWQSRQVISPPADIDTIRRPSLRMLRHSIEDFMSRVRQ